MNCSYCNTPLIPEDTVCPGCGTPVPAQQQPAYAPQQPAYAPQQPAYAPQQPAYAPQPTYAAPQPAYAAPQPTYAAPQYAPAPAAAKSSVPNTFLTRYFGAYDLVSGRPMRGVFHLLLACFSLMFLLLILDHFLYYLIPDPKDILDLFHDIFSKRFYRIFAARGLIYAILIFIINSIWAAADSNN